MTTRKKLLNIKGISEAKVDKIKVRTFMCLIMIMVTVYTLSELVDCYHKCTPWKSLQVQTPDCLLLCDSVFYSLHHTFKYP